jgi:hypothetical protein
MVGAILRKGGLLGRLLMLAVGVCIIFFDFYQWPLMIGAIALAVGSRQKLPEPQEESPRLRKPSLLVTKR